MPKYAWNQVKKGIVNPDGRFFPCVLKNKRVMGLKSVSISFKTDEKIEKMHIYPACGKIQKMAILSRCFLFGIPEVMEEIKKSTNRLHVEDVSFAKENQQSLEHYYQNFNCVISFRLFEYEKQLFYIKAMQHNSPFAILRAIYNSDFNKFNWEDVNEDLMTQLLNGINLIEFLQENLSFTEFPSLF
ncbi:hypothetical protein [Candidatus Lokiarchaeum ossiferum]|uniref:hypothetical protein n=1 Tax=Candidatus Lokiarchaeum ossiferum TaxID=2951803 RepID=UPI00352C3EA3